MLFLLCGCHYHVKSYLSILSDNNSHLWHSATDNDGIPLASLLTVGTLTLSAIADLVGRRRLLMTNRNNVYKRSFVDDLCGVPLTDDCLLGELLGPDISSL